jgi:hypothetical protein
MSYTKPSPLKSSTLKLSRGRTPLDGFFGDLASGGSSVLSFLGAQQRAEGAQAALTQQNMDLTAALAAQSSGPDMFDLAIIGGLGYLGYRLFFAKKAA